MAKIKLDFPVLDENGEVLNKDKTAGQILASALLRAAGEDESDILKFHMWALRLGSNLELDLDEADKKTLHKHIVNDKTLPVVTKAPIMILLDSIKFNKKID